MVCKKTSKRRQTDTYRELDLEGRRGNQLGGRWNNHQGAQSKTPKGKNLQSIQPKVGFTAPRRTQQPKHMNRQLLSDSSGDTSYYAIPTDRKEKRPTVPTGCSHHLAANLGTTNNLANGCTISRWATSGQADRSPDRERACCHTLSKAC